MNRDEIGKLIVEAVQRSRGHAEFFDWPDKSVKEWGVATTFVEELERDCKVLISSVKLHPGGANHAPDVQLTKNDGENWGVEITELVSQAAIEKTKQGEIPDTEWLDEELVRAFHAIVARKDRPENVKGGPYDRYLLLVHTDEPELPFAQLAETLGRLDFQTRLIDEIHVLVSYDPGRERCPILHLRATKG